MPVLKSLTFTAMPKVSNDPVQLRREKFVRKLEEQKQLLVNPAFVRTIQRTKVVDGEKRVIPEDRKVKPWWRTEANGQLTMSIRFGSKPVEFEKGKSGIAVPSKDKLSGVIDTLISAVRAGELDEILGQASKLRPFPKGKKGA